MTGNIITKAHMKTGRIVTLRNGEVGMVFREKDERICIITMSGHLTCFDDHMRNTMFPEYDVLFVYETNSIYWSDLFRTKRDLHTDEHINKLGLYSIQSDELEVGKAINKLLDKLKTDNLVLTDENKNITIARANQV